VTFVFIYNERENMNKKAVLLFPILFLLASSSACSTISQPALTSINTPELISPAPIEVINTITPTTTPVPPITPTLLPVLTSTSTSVVEKAVGTPLPHWKGIPIIPGAIEGGPTDFNYVYSVYLSVEDTEQFYIEHLGKENWELEKREASEISTFGGPVVILDFIRNTERVNIIMAYSTHANYTTIIMTR
jgi:hypothetical protein